jgi:hypothetical protein
MLIKGKCIFGFGLICLDFIMGFFSGIYERIAFVKDWILANSDAGSCGPKNNGF